MDNPNYGICPVHGIRMGKDPGEPCNVPDHANMDACSEILKDPHKGKALPPRTESATDVLREAADTIEQRAAQRDVGEERSMPKALAAWWTLYGDNIKARGYPTDWEGWEFMSLLKKARKASGAYQADDFLDDPAYCALSAESASEEEDSG